MGTTNAGLPYPEQSDPPDGATQIQALAEAVDTAIMLMVQSGVTPPADFEPVVGGEPCRIAPITITFDTPYLVPPIVIASTNNGWRWCDVQNITATDFQTKLFDLRPNITATGITWDWRAIGPVVLP